MGKMCQLSLTEHHVMVRHCISHHFRFVDDEWIVQQCLVRVQMLSKSLTGEEIARELITVLSVSYHICSGNLLATMRD